MFGLCGLQWEAFIHLDARGRSKAGCKFVHRIHASPTFPRIAPFLGMERDVGANQLTAGKGHFHCYINLEEIVFFKYKNPTHRIKKQLSVLSTEF